MLQDNVVDRYLDEILNEGNFEHADDILAPGFVFYGPSTKAGLDTQGFMRFIEELRAAFSNKHFVEMDRLVDGNRVAIRFRMTGTHDGTYQGCPPMGASIDVEGCDLIYLENGKISELRAYFDLMAIMQRVLIPPPIRMFGELLEQLWPR